MEAEKPIIFFSRSATETLDRCPARWYWEYGHEGKGIRPAYTSIPLTTGTAVHEGVAYLLNCLRIGQVLDSERVMQAVKAGTDKYEEIVKSQYKGVESNYGNEYTYLEQSNLTAGLIVLWALTEGKDIPKLYEVIEVEREERFTLLEAEKYIIDFEARADALLKSKNAKNDYLLYSLKTSKRWYKNQKDNLKHDLQGITETIAVKKRWEQEEKARKIIVEASKHGGFSKKHLDAFETVCLNAMGKSLIGVRYCVLVKGDYKEPFDGADFKCTHSPIVRGYKKVDVAEKLYAHSWYFPNPNNKSGTGALGKGWTPFNVWEEFKVEDWVTACFEGEVQGNAKQNFLELVNVMEVYRDRESIHQTEQELVTRLEKPELFLAKQGKITPVELPFFFPKFRTSCHYPSDCDFIKICHEGHTPEVGNGWSWREPHHEGERENG